MGPNSLKYKTSTNYRYPFVFGGILVLLGSGFFYRKFLLNDEEIRRELYKAENKEAGQIIYDFKKEFNK